MAADLQPKMLQVLLQTPTAALVRDPNKQVKVAWSSRGHQDWSTASGARMIHGPLPHGEEIASVPLGSHDVRGEFDDIGSPLGHQIRDPVPTTGLVVRTEPHGIAARSGHDNR